jgi:hypothetical protein
MNFSPLAVEILSLKKGQYSYYFSLSSLYLALARAGE